MTYPYEEMDPLNPPPPASEYKPDDEIKVENRIKHEDETVPVSVHKTIVSSREAHAFIEKKRKAKDKFYGKLFLELGNEVCSSVDQGMDAMEKLVTKLGNTEDKVGCKKLKKELEEERFSNTFLRMQNERVKRDHYWTRVRAHEFYQEMIRRGFMFEKRPNEAINVSIKDEKSHLILPPKYAPMTQVAICRMIKDAAPTIRGCTFVRFMKCNPAVVHGVEGDVKLRRWFEKTESVLKISEYTEGKKVKFADATLEGPNLTWWITKAATMGLENVNQMPWTEMKQLMTTEFFRIEEPERVKVEAYIRGLTDNIKGEVTSSKPADLNEAVCMAHILMEQKSQARDAWILEGKKRK
uniref:Reverse transcriptase domain-containing protein n=1 Tax=Tanacetum cinerariifolium TaxID=118510 RepID=A0A6L2KV04_TANCI|nr:hypothetical protein [Tanacetum cinerariifolium]